MEKFNNLEEKVLRLKADIESSLGESKGFIAQMSPCIFKVSPIAISRVEKSQASAEIIRQESTENTFDCDLLSAPSDSLMFSENELDSDEDQIRLSEMEKSDYLESSWTVPVSLSERLLKVAYICIEFQSLEISDKSICGDNLWIEFYLPGFKDVSRNGKFRTKLGSATQNRRKAMNCTKLMHTAKVFYKFDTLLTQKWMCGEIQFKILVLGNKLGVKSNSLVTQESEIFSACAVLKTSDILVNDNLSYSGELPLFYNIGKSRKHPLSTAGHLSIKTTLIEETILTESEHTKPVEDVEIEIQTKAPIYLHFYLKHARGLESERFIDCSNPLLFLRIRLFSSSSNNFIETHPVLFSNPLDASSLTNTSGTNFNFSHTMPLAMNSEFIKSHGKAPIISEIRMVSASSTESQLLGLVRLPFDQLVSAMLLSTNDTIDLNHYQIPEADYAIKDPISGENKGWIRGFLAIGNWKHIEKLRLHFSDVPDVMCS